MIFHIPKHLIVVLIRNLFILEAMNVSNNLKIWLLLLLSWVIDV